MPFTHSYSSPGVSTAAGYNKVAHIPTSSSNTSTTSLDASSTPHAHPSSPSHRESTRPRLFSSGRKSPDPFRRFRRSSSSNSLNISTAPPAPDAAQSFALQQQTCNSPISPDPINRRPASPAPLHTPRSAPPPLPSPSTKPIFQRPKRTKSSSISILSTGLGLRSKDNLSLPPSTHSRRRHRKSASLSGSDLDFASPVTHSPRAATPQPMLRPASPSPSLSESIYSINHDIAPTSSAVYLPPFSAYQSKQHKQAWYQAQQKTIQLENPYNRHAEHPDSEIAKLFPLNVATTSTSVASDNLERGHQPPAHLRSPRPVVETFLSEEEMIAAGIHIIRRRDHATTTTSHSSKHLSSLSIPYVDEQASAPTMPPRLYGADHPDFLELIDSPITSKQPSPLLEQLVDPPSASVSRQRALSHTHNTSSSGSLSISSSSSTDYFPQSTTYNEDASSLHNSSTGSLSSGSKHSFSFAKLRRNGTKLNNVGGSSRPSTAQSCSNEHVSSNKTFLFPPQSTQPLQPQTHPQQQQLAQQSLSGGLSAPGYLKPGPGSSASPFLNKHSATVGHASGSVGAGYTAQNGLAHVFNGGDSSATTCLLPSSSASNAYHATSTDGVPPPKPSKPEPSLIPKSATNSICQSISAPTSAQFDPRYDSNRNGISRDMLSPPGSAGLFGNDLYGCVSHSRSQEAVTEARLDAEALRASAGTPMPPPRRLGASRGVNGNSGGSSTAYSGQAATAMWRNTSGGGSGGGVVGALGHVGQLGAAMGKKGWDFMKTLQSSHSATASGRSGTYAPSYRNGAGSIYSSSVAAAENEPTRLWLKLLDGPDLARSTAGSVFGAPLKDTVLRTRLSSIGADEMPHHNDEHLGVPDLGKEFSANFLESPGVTPRSSVAGTVAGEPLSREEARHLFLPRIVVRCIESLEKWGPSEEGIYRVSGRSSHTSKLRAHFSDPHNDLRLDEINPADLDINSVCSLLKSYLRELPETPIPLVQSKALDQVVARLLADTETRPTEAAGGSGGKATDARTAHMSADKVAQELTPLVRQLPVYNWYLLRELTHHLGLLAEPEVVVRTKMPISNLTLVLAPTVSISLPLLQVLVRHREVVFVGPAPSEDMIASPTLTSLPSGVQEAKRKTPPPKPAKPERLSSPASRLPVMVRKRASSMGLGALLSSPTTKTAASAPAPQPKHEPNRLASDTASLNLPAFAGPSGASGPTSPLRVQPTSPSLADEPYERPSTSLGHFAEFRPKPAPSTCSSSASLSNHRRFGSRDAALRFNALALDDSSTNDGILSSPTRKRDERETPIARYYARIRKEAERTVDQENHDDGRDGAKTPMAIGMAPTCATAVAGDAGVEMDGYRAEKMGKKAGDLLSLTPTLDMGIGRMKGGAISSALDRPRPPTSRSASFFSGSSRRQDSVNGLVWFSKPGHDKNNDDNQKYGSCTAMVRDKGERERKKDI
uniref:-domain-containing protein n=1 Tax=Melanopsichium pennsylvanicum 4 TaxID=1398559 RepID=A0A077R8T3_9BASI|nr:-domain-containing protein [Melanopsichium pennsylvanicum 4]